MYLRVESGKIVDASFTGRGCAISTAAASMLSEKVKGQSIEDLAQMDEHFIRELLGVEINPARKTCATLALTGFQRASQKIGGAPG